MLPEELVALAARVRDSFTALGWMVATGESCTGGLIAGCLTEVSGSSAVVDRGFITYTNTAKQQVLGVPEALLATHGAVSEPVAAAMADGVLTHSEAHVSLAVTGVAGPTGGTPSKPVGLVFIARGMRGGVTVVERHVFTGDRSDVRHATVKRALELALAAAEETP